MLTLKYFRQVEAYLQHYGHNLELGHTRIHWHDRKLIEEKLKNGISRHKILDEIRGSLDQTSDLSRIHLVSLQVSLSTFLCDNLEKNLRLGHQSCYFFKLGIIKSY